MIIDDGLPKNKAKQFAGIAEAVATNTAKVKAMLAGGDRVLAKEFAAIVRELSEAGGYKVTMHELRADEAVEFLVSHAVMLPLFELTLPNKALRDANPVSKVVAKAFALFERHGVDLATPEVQAVAHRVAWGAAVAVANEVLAEALGAPPPVRTID